MDSQKFDAMTRELASTTSRRGLLKGAIGGGALAVLGRSGASARATTACGPSPTDAIVYQIIAIIANLLRSIGIPIAVPTPPEPVTCPEGTELNPDTCECDCVLTTGDCPGGVDEAACACIPVICEEANTSCGAAELDCDCVRRVDFDGNTTDELVCVDHGGPNGYECGDGEHTCPDGMVCAWDESQCEGTFCYPVCGEAAAFRHLPNLLV